MPADRSLRFGRYRLHPTQGLTRGSAEVRLTPKSLAVLRTLAERRGQIVMKDELFRTVWPDTAVSDAALSSCILELRQALRDDARRPRYIETVHRRGFRFVARCLPEFPDPGEIDYQYGRSDHTGPLVDRDQALDQLSQALARASTGSRQVVFIMGEAGIGKTVLVEHFIAGLGRPESWCICRGACIERTGAGEAYQPLLDALSRLPRVADGKHVLTTLRRCAPSWLAELPAVQTAAELRALQRRTAGATPERLLRELNDALEVLSAQTPVVLWLEDLHWSDASTLDWIASFARRRERAAVLLVATYRHEEGNESRRLHDVATDLSLGHLCTVMPLGPLDERAILEYIVSRFPPAEESVEALHKLAGAIHRHTEGNPFFMVSALDDLIAGGRLACRGGRWVAERDLDSDSLGVPSDVGRTIRRQLDRVTDVERGLLEVASVAGVVCAAAAVAAGAEMPIDEVEVSLGALARRGAFLNERPATTWPDGTVSGTFEFRHALQREVLLERITPARRARLHQLIGSRLEAGYLDRALEISGELALHFEKGGNGERAVVYRQHAGDIDRRRSAHRAAERHFHRALAMLEGLPASGERDGREAVLRVAHAGTLIATAGLGAAGAEQTWARALELSQQSDITPHLLDVLGGLWVFYVNRGPLRTAREIADRLFDCAMRSGDSALLLEAHHLKGGTAFFEGDLDAVRSHTDRTIALGGPRRPGALALTYGCTLHDFHLKNHCAAACASAFSAWAHALGGRTETAARALDAAVAYAHDLQNPYTLAVTLVTSAAVLHVARDAGAARRRAVETAVIAREHGFGPILAWATVYEGRALCDLGLTRRGLALMGEGLATCRKANLPLFQPFLLALAAEAELRSGRLDEASESLEHAFAIAQGAGERCFAAERHRVRAELRLATSRDSESRRRAEEDARAALQISRSQGARLLTLRASVSLARILAGTRKSAEARALLSAALEEVPERRELPDLADAVRLLNSESNPTVRLSPGQPSPGGDRKH